VTAGHYEVEVVGTRFSVLYEPPDALEVQVERGAVSVKVPHRQTPIQLTAGERLHAVDGRVALLHGPVLDAEMPSDPSDGVPGARSGDGPAVDPDARFASGDAARGFERATWRTLFDQGRYGESLAAAKSIGIDRLLATLGPESLVALADVARLGGDPALAVRVLELLLRRFPASAQGKESRFLLGRLHVLRGEGPRAIAAFESYLNLAGSLPYAGEAMGRLMELYAAQNDIQKARALAQRYLEHSPNGPYRRLARSLTGMPAP
jgi:hypothetical protein